MQLVQPETILRWHRAGWHCQSKFVYFAKTSEPDFAAIDYPEFFRVDLSGFDGRSKYLEFALTTPGREFDDALLEQLEAMPELVAACGFQNAKAPGYEADDFLAAAAAKEEKRGGTVLVASGDRDTFQLASDRTTILYPVRAGEMARIGPTEVRARYGVDPEQVPDFIALRGDPSDKLPGAPGVGAIGAATLLQRYGTLEAALAAGRFPAMAEDLRLYRSIATMDKKAPLPRLRNQTPTWHKAAALAREWELNQLAGRLEELADG